MLYWVEFYFMPRAKAKNKYNSGGSRERAPGVVPPHPIILFWVKKFAEKTEMPARQAKNRAREEPLYFGLKKTQREENPEGQAKQNWPPLAQRLEPITWSLKVKRKCG